MKDGDVGAKHDTALAKLKFEKATHTCTCPVGIAIILIYSCCEGTSNLPGRKVSHYTEIILA